MVGGGSYGAQLISNDPSKASGARVFFQPAAGASVSVARFDLGQDPRDLRGPKHVLVKDMAVTYMVAWTGSDDLVWQNIRGKHFDLIGATNVRIVGGDFGPCQAPAEDLACVPRIAGGGNVVLDGVTIHDMTSTNPDYHVDGLFIRGSTNVVVRNSKFRGNMITNIRIQPQDCCSNANITLENNWFAPPLQSPGGMTRSDGIDVDVPASGLLIRNNSFGEGVGIQLAGNYSGTSTRIVNNLLTSFGCIPGVEYSNNVFIPFSPYNGQSPCGRTDKKVSTFGYANNNGFDYHLALRSPAMKRADWRNCPSLDIDRQGRPPKRVKSCDAGSDQRSIVVCHAIGKRSKARRLVSLVIDPTRLRAHLRQGDHLGTCRK
jgi:hypothetical protein